MSATTWLPLYTPPTPSFISQSSKLKPSSFFKSSKNSSTTCKASSSSSSSSSSSWITDLDLYDLLGLDSSSDQSQIKSAYRMLQKRCHPDIAGPAGHDMAIILNQAYSVLSDPNSRLAYDKEQEKITELKGYSGKPMYSVWMGSESEERAVFVDEVKCVGCLKCALFADKTFAIESVYGRARVVAQWADPENKIIQAIEACPVDCISMVERSDLAALEFLMSKQPRGNVRVGAGNSVGTRVSNIFVDVKKFQTRFTDTMKKADHNQSCTETDLQRETRMSAIQAIRSISNWLYWQYSPTPTSNSQQKLKLVKLKLPEPDHLKKLREVAAARKKARQNNPYVKKTLSAYIYHEEYWIPSMQALPFSSTLNSHKPRAAVSEPIMTSPDNKRKNIDDEGSNERTEYSRRNTMIWRIPICTAMVAAVAVWLQVGDGSIGELKEHVAGSLALSVINSSWLQVALAGVMWYFMGVAVVELVEAIRNNK